MKTVNVKFGPELMKEIKKRAKKSYTTATGLIENIVRRSMLSYKGGTKRNLKIDDKLVSIFSRERRGRKKKAKKVKKK